MNNPLLVVRAINTALKFTMEHRNAYYRHAAPVTWLFLFLSILQYMLGVGFFILNGLFQVVILASFAVYWHRYTILPAVRTVQGFTLQFGMRELRYCIAAIPYAFLILIWLFSFRGGIIAGIVGLLILWSLTLGIVFVFPAIALNQPLRLGRFFQEGFSIILPFIVGVAYSIFLLLIPIVIVVGFMLFAKTFLPTDLVFTIGLAATNIFIFPLIIAFAASTTSVLFYQRIGME